MSSLISFVFIPKKLALINYYRIDIDKKFKCHKSFISLISSQHSTFMHFLKNDLYIDSCQISQFANISIIVEILVNKYKMSKSIKTVQQKNEDYFKTVEAGDISLFDIFDEAVAMFGFTKVGKTSSCHILANSPLKSQSSNGDYIYRPATQKYMNATVGLTTQSQTEIPNIFVTKFKDKNNVIKSVIILDQPGYGDSYGFHRIFSNGYFHYRTFSKTPKLKFILAFKKVDLEGTGEKFKSTIEYFINTFASYDAVKSSIMNATSFLITQADPHSNINNLRGAIERIRDSYIAQVTQQQNKRFKELINNMLNGNKIFFIEKPEQAGIATRQCFLLKEIYEKTTFWTRDVRSNVADMTPINFSVGSQILSNLYSLKGKSLFREEFDHFMNFMERRVKQFLVHHKYSLLNIIKILIKDAVSGVQDHNFLKGMNEFVSQFYNFIPVFEKQRQKRLSNLFSSGDLSDSSESLKTGMINNSLAQHQRQERQRETRQVYFIKKFGVLEFLHQSIRKLGQNSYQKNFVRDIQWLESTSSFFVDLFKKFTNLRVQRSDPERIIYKYSYLIQRLIEESKIITLILFSNSEIAHKFDSYRQIMVDVYRPLKDQVFIEIIEINVANLKLEFIKKLNFDSFEIVNKDIILFFETLPHHSEAIYFKIARLIIKYGEIILQKKGNAKDDERRFITYKLFHYRNKFYAFLKNIMRDNRMEQKEDKIKSIELIFALSNHLGNFLSGFNLYEEAREVFKSLNNSEFVFKNFDAQMKVHQNNIAKSRSLLMSYGKYAGECHRSELAMKCFQQAYAKSYTFQQLKEVSLEIIALKTSQINNNQDIYLKRFYNQEFCGQFSESLKSKISMIYQQEKILTPN